jgi:hypothetical protein
MMLEVRQHVYVLCIVEAKGHNHILPNKTENIVTKSHRVLREWHRLRQSGVGSLSGSSTFFERVLGSTRKSICTDVRRIS